MNREEAYRQITEYWELVKACKAMPLFSSERRAAVKLLNNDHLPRVNRVLQVLAPDLRPIRASMVSEHLAAQPTVVRALTILKRWETMASLQQMVGEPVLSMSMLDPVIGKAASPLWMAGKYRQAVNDAATHLSTFVQSQIGRDDISDKDLMAQAFSDKPPEKGKARLRCPGNPENETVRSQQEGARAFSIGTFQAIRNPAHHMTGDWNPELAFHYLAALSQVAYWFRHWNVDRYYAPPPNLSVVSAATSE
jgi:uncharacterized protein (TIGR02391 family)